MLPAEQYRVISLTRPAVPDEEMIEAIRWQLKDQIDYAIDEAVIDYFPYPESLPGEPKLYATVAHRSVIENIVMMSQEARLNLKVIDINELSIRNMLLPQLKEGQNVAFIGEQLKGIIFNCFLGHDFVFSRQLAGSYFPRLTVENDFSLDNDLIDSDTSDQLLLEIQRTLDYYESQIARNAITKLIIPDLGSSTENVSQLLKNNLGSEIEVLQPEKLCQWSDSISSHLICSRMAVSGCALRTEGKVNAAS